MCVQPMKSIAAVALNGDLDIFDVTTAGILTGGLILLFGVTNFIEIVNLIIPFTVVSGMQIGLGLKLAGKGTFIREARKEIDLQESIETTSLMNKWILL